MSREELNGFPRGGIGFNMHGDGGYPEPLTEEQITHNINVFLRWYSQELSAPISLRPHAKVHTFTSENYQDDLYLRITALSDYLYGTRRGLARGDLAEILLEQGLESITQAQFIPAEVLHAPLIFDKDIGRGDLLLAEREQGSAVYRPCMIINVTAHTGPGDEEMTYINRRIDVPVGKLKVGGLRWKGETQHYTIGGFRGIEMIQAIRAGNYDFIGLMDPAAQANFFSVLMPRIEEMMETTQTGIENAEIGSNYRRHLLHMLSIARSKFDLK